ncbi:MAG: hypothetical protein PHF86_05050 [Candidatus Nanoarchaeia archaeon]|jgi:predicted regulator of amino acid metabolism with ACT domain|nr:hypothetical protein [Candidatus Nanoarchaeia archaeon]
MHNSTTNKGEQMQVNLIKTDEETQATFTKRIAKILNALAKKGINITTVSFDAPTKNKNQEITVINTITPAGTFE